MGFPLTLNLGRYLGVPILHDRTSTQTYQDIIDKISKKLTGWKVKSLSLAGRVTLAQSVLAAIPAYVMQTAVIPATTCDAIDRLIRNFVWGSSDETRKVHLVSWEQICKPNDEGGLGLKLARSLNRAYMMKLAFIFFQEPKRLWVQILQGKYMKEDANGLTQRLVGMLPPREECREDEWIWGGESNGSFSIKSAYNIICRSVSVDRHAWWKQVWSWKGPNRIRCFLWLAF
ncbi:Putative ribonuclease H protein At1g65750 [Linum perenne]